MIQKKVITVFISFLILLSVSYGIKNIYADKIGKLAAVIYQPGIPTQSVSAPKIPTSFTYTASSCGGKVTIFWAPVLGANSYNVYRASTINGSYSRATSTLVTLNMFQDSPGQGTFYYKVSATGDYGTSAFSAAYGVKASLPCVAPKTVPTFSIKTSTTCGGKVDFVFPVVLDVDGYHIYRLDPNKNSYAEALNSPVGGNKFTDNVNPGTSVTYKVSSYNKAGEGPLSQAYNVKSSVSCPVPAVPTNLSAKKGTVCGGKIDISWNSIIDATSYQLYRDNLTSPIYTGNDILYSDSNLDPTITHTYKIQAINKIGSSTISLPVTSQASGLCTPASPLGVSAKADSSCGGKILVNWNKVLGATKYHVYRSTSQDGSYSEVSGSGITETSFVDDTIPLNSQAQFYYKVTSENKSGSSLSSAVVVGTPSSACPVDPGIIVPDSEKSDVIADWDGVGDTNGNKICDLGEPCYKNLPTNPNVRHDISGLPIQDVIGQKKPPISIYTYGVIQNREVEDRDKLDQNCFVEDHEIIDGVTDMVNTVLRFDTTKPNCSLKGKQNFNFAYASSEPFGANIQAMLNGLTRTYTPAENTGSPLELTVPQADKLQFVASQLKISIKANYAVSQDMSPSGSFSDPIQTVSMSIDEPNIILSRSDLNNPSGDNYSQVGEFSGKGQIKIVEKFPVPSGYVCDDTTKIVFVPTYISFFPDVAKSEIKGGKVLIHGDFSIHEESGGLSNISTLCRNPQGQVTSVGAGWSYDVLNDEHYDISATKWDWSVPKYRNLVNKQVNVLGSHMKVGILTPTGWGSGNLAPYTVIEPQRLNINVYVNKCYSYNGRYDENTCESLLQGNSPALAEKTVAPKKQVSFLSDLFSKVGSSLANVWDSFVSIFEKEKNTQVAVNSQPTTDGATIDSFTATNAFITWFGTQYDTGVKVREKGSVSGRLMKGYSTSDMYCAFPMPRHLPVALRKKYPNTDAGQTQLNEDLKNYYMIVERVGDPEPNQNPVAQEKSVYAEIVDRGAKDRGVIDCSPAVLRTLGIKSSYIDSNKVRVGNRVNVKMVPKSSVGIEDFMYQDVIDPTPIEIKK